MTQIPMSSLGGNQPYQTGPMAAQSGMMQPRPYGAPVPISAQPAWQGGVQNEAGPIVDMYSGTLGRNPDQAGLDFYRGKLAGGMPLSEIQSRISASPEAGRNPGEYIPASGLRGAETNYGQGINAIRSGVATGRADIDQGLGRSAAGTDAFRDQLNPWANQGLDAFNMQAAFTGAAGPEAQQEAYANFRDSPGQDWRREQMQRETDNYAARTGQSQGGNVLAELQRRALNLAEGSYGANYDRLGGIASLGGQASSQLASGELSSGQFDAGLYGRKADLAAQGGRDEGGMQARMGDVRYGAGRDLSSNIGGTVSSLSNLQTGQGINDADIYGAGATDIANIINQSGANAGQVAMDMGTTLANINTGAGSQSAPYVAGAGAATGGALGQQYQAWGQGIGGGLDALSDYYNQ